MKNFKFLSIRHIFRLAVVMLLLAVMSITPALALDPPEITSSAVILIETNTDQELYSVNADEKMYPASLTKIMTVMLAVEAIEEGKVTLYDSVTASDKCKFDLTDDGSSSNITAGETMSLQDLLYCAMLASANESCNIIAEYIGGSVENFVAMMNEKAAELGCRETHFVNTHGLPHSNHYTTARDLSIITRAASEYPLFMEICSSAGYTVPATNVSEVRKLSNSNALVTTDSMYSDDYYYSDARGVKTGFTSAAGYCLASTASRNGMDLLAVVLGGTASGEAGNTRYSNFGDSIRLYEWAFTNYSYQDILRTTDMVTEVPVALGSGRDSVVLRPGSAINALLPNDTDMSSFQQDIMIFSEENGEKLTAPIDAGEVLGEITIQRDGVIYGTAPLIASAAVELSRMEYMKGQVAAALSSLPARIIMGLLLAIIVIYIVLVVRYRILYRKHRQRQEARRAAGVSAPERKKTTVHAGASSKRMDDIIPPMPDSAQPSEERDYFEEFFGQKK